MYKGVALVLATASLAAAIPASPFSFSSHQPNMNSLGARQRLIGTPAYSYTVVETLDGSYTTMMDVDGYIKHAVIDEHSGKLVPSKYIVGEPIPEGVEIELHQVESSSVIAKKCEDSDYCRWQRDTNSIPHTRPLEGDYKNLVVPFKYAGHEERDLNMETVADKLFNGKRYSVKDFFEKQSYKKLNVVTDIAPEVTIRKSESMCADGVSGLSSTLHECLKEALVGKDTSGYDSVTFVHSGYGAEHGDQDEFDTYYTDRVWSHSWVIDATEYSGRYAMFSAFYGKENGHVNRVGVAVHEMAQAMGAATLYGSVGAQGYGLGYYDVMAHPWGFDGTLETCGSMSAYTKQLFGWVDVEEIDEDGLKDITSADIDNKVFKISKGFPTNVFELSRNGRSTKEYLLIENRADTDYDLGLLQPGLAIYHIDETANDLASDPSSEFGYPLNHYRVALVQADGRFDLERGEDAGDGGDLFHADRFAGVDSFGPLDRFGNRMTDVMGGERVSPTTMAYQGGTLRDTNIVVSGVSLAGERMEFAVTFASSSVIAV